MVIQTKPPVKGKGGDASSTFSRTSILENKKPRSAKAEEYEKKVTGIVGFAMRMCAGNPKTVADAAALIEHGEAFAAKMGDLAAHDKRVQNGIDVIASGSDNPYIAVALATLPLISQIIRNHETETANPIQVKIPFIKRIFRPRIRVRLNVPVLRALTEHPVSYIRRIFGDPAIKAALISNGIDVALPEYQDTGNGHAS